jgi:hypothetical protein
MVKNVSMFDFGSSPSANTLVLRMLEINLCSPNTHNITVNLKLRIQIIHVV